MDFLMGIASIGCPSLLVGDFAAIFLNGFHIRDEPITKVIHQEA
jgi:hypothetical protein